MNGNASGEEFDESGPESPDVAAPSRKAERLLCDLWPTVTADEPPQNILATTIGRGQGAAFIAARHPQASVSLWMLDVYHADLVQAAQASAVADNLHIRCEADCHVDRLDAAAIPVSSQGEAELTRERLQSAFVDLRPGGVLLATTDNPRDSWLREVLESFDQPVRRIPAADGVGYVVRRGESPPKRIRNFDCEFVFRDREHKLKAITRPGVFSHRKVDAGARRLLDVLDVRDGLKVFDIGCGWGTVGLCAAVRAQSTVFAIDSNVRAVECAAANARNLNVDDRLTARLEAYGQTDAPGTFDLALANPPYYAQFQIAERFVAAAESALRSGGQLWIVAKHAEWYEERLPHTFADVTVTDARGYVILGGRKR